MGPMLIVMVFVAPVPSLRLIPGTDHCIVDQHHPGSQGNRFGYEDGSVRRSSDGGVSARIASAMRNHAPAFHILSLRARCCLSETH